MKSSFIDVWCIDIIFAIENEFFSSIDFLHSNSNAWVFETTFVNVSKRITIYFEKKIKRENQSIYYNKNYQKKNFNKKKQFYSNKQFHQLRVTWQANMFNFTTKQLIVIDEIFFKI